MLGTIVEFNFVPNSQENITFTFLVVIPWSLHNQNHVRCPCDSDAHAEVEVRGPAVPEELLDLVGQLLLGLVEDGDQATFGMCSWLSKGGL